MLFSPWANTIKFWELSPLPKTGESINLLFLVIQVIMGGWLLDDSPLSFRNFTLNVADLWYASFPDQSLHCSSYSLFCWKCSTQNFLMAVVVFACYYFLYSYCGVLQLWVGALTIWEKPYYDSLAESSTPSWDITLFTGARKKKDTYNYQTKQWPDELLEFV